MLAVALGAACGGETQPAKPDGAVAPGLDAGIEASVDSGEVQTPACELGPGTRTWQAFGRDPILLYAGSQGGFHVFFGARVLGMALSPAPTGDRFQATTDLRVTRVDSNATLADVELRMPFQAEDGNGLAYHSGAHLVQLAVLSQAELEGVEIRLEAVVRNGDGDEVSGSADVTVTAAP